MGLVLYVIIRLLLWSAGVAIAFPDPTDHPRNALLVVADRGEQFNRRDSTLYASFSLNVSLPIAGEVHGLAALHCQRGYAAHLIAIGDAAVILTP
jgi:hypothetical protein